MSGCVTGVRVDDGSSVVTEEEDLDDTADESAKDVGECSEGCVALVG